MRIKMQDKVKHILLTKRHCRDNDVYLLYEIWSKEFAKYNLSQISGTKVKPKAGSTSQTTVAVISMAKNWDKIAGNRKAKFDKNYMQQVLDSHDEVYTRIENQLITGKDPDYAISTGANDFGNSHSIIIKSHLSRVEKLNLIPLRGGKYPSTNKITDGTVNLLG